MRPMPLVIRQMICCSCKQEFKKTTKSIGNFCSKCNRRVSLKLEWRGCQRRLAVTNLRAKAKAKTKKRMDNINSILITEFGVDMSKDMFSNPEMNVKH